MPVVLPEAGGGVVTVGPLWRAGAAGALVGAAPAAKASRAPTAEPWAQVVPARASPAGPTVGLLLPAPAQLTGPAVDLATALRNVSLFPMLVNPVFGRAPAGAAILGLKSVAVEVRPLLCDPAVIDLLLSANYREEMRSLSAAGKQEELKADAFHFLSVITVPAEQHYAFAALMETALPATEGTDARKRVDAFLALFPAASDMRRAALVFAASWCYDGEKYDLALEKVAELKALPGSTVEMQAGALMTESLCRIRQNDDQGAQTILAGIVKDYGKTTLAPKAQFLIGWIHIWKQDNQGARAALNQVIKDYPSTEYADRARRLLDSLKADQ